MALPLYIAEREMCFLELYLSHISTMQEMHGKGRALPVAIMTSDDTHALTLQLLKKRAFFGMPESQITIMKQNKVPAMLDATARFAGKDGSIDTKPHGHGDVHTLLHQHAIDAWAAAGIKWVVFFQDTNGPIFRSMAAVLGVSNKLNLAVNSVCVPRTPGRCRPVRFPGFTYSTTVLRQPAAAIFAAGFRVGTTAGCWLPAAGCDGVVLSCGCRRKHRVGNETGSGGCSGGCRRGRGRHLQAPAPRRL